MAIFHGGNVMSDNKNEYNCFYGKGVPDTALKFFPQETTQWLNESQKTSFGNTYPSISVVLLSQFLPKTTGFSYWWTHNNYINFMNIADF